MTKNTAAAARYRSTFMHEGKRHEATSTVSQKEADAKAALKKDRLERGEVGLSGNMTVSRWAYEWLETYKKPAVTDKSYKEYKRQVDNHINPAIGSLRLTDVRDIHLQKILNSRAGLSSSPLRYLRNTLTGIFSRARKSRLIQYDPSLDLELPKARNGTRRSMTDIEREHFLKAAETHHDGLMFKSMLYCGLRTGEAAALSWGDIDFGAQMLKVRHAMESGSNRMAPPKTAAGSRDIPIPGAIYHDILRESEGKGPGDPVFTRKHDNLRHTETSRLNAWNSLKKEMDISMGATFGKKKARDGKMRMAQLTTVVAEDLVPYCLRHTFCTDLQDRGVPINVAKYLMGHTSIEVTARIYTHITDRMLRETAARMDIMHSYPHINPAAEEGVFFGGVENSVYADPGETPNTA